MVRRLCLFLPLLLASSVKPAVLQIHVVHGDRAVHQPGSRVQTPLVVKITGETGEAVDGALVSFRLPASGPGGLFANGLATDIVRTGADGAAAMPPVRWNTSPGSFEIRVTAAKDAARAGLMVSQSLGEAQTTSMVTVHPGAASARPRRKWILLVAGVAAGSLAAGMAVAKGRTDSSSAAPATPGLSVGTPSISIGGPK
ncbi:MAG TPA: hypothetical protein VLE22_01270 [Bryobacteraceae bacterium]|nr:hypothetical protein [Bryobacteraceae bacterium]